MAPKFYDMARHEPQEIVADFWLADVDSIEVDSSGLRYAINGWNRVRGEGSAGNQQEEIIHHIRQIRQIPL